jgi:hypothetical protein
VPQIQDVRMRSAKDQWPLYTVPAPVAAHHNTFNAHFNNLSVLLYEN